MSKNNLKDSIMKIMCSKRKIFCKTMPENTRKSTIDFSDINLDFRAFTEK